MALHDFHFDGITHRERSTLVCSRVRVPGSMIDQVEVYTGFILRFNPFDEILNFPYVCEGVATTHGGKDERLCLERYPETTQ